MFNRYNLIVAVVSLLLVSCGADGDYQGVEYAPHMAHSVAYEPLTQFSEEDKPSLTPWQIHENVIPVNDYGFGPDAEHMMNMMTPVTGSVKRQYYKHDSLKTKALFDPAIHPDSAAMAGRLLKNPLPVGDAQVLAEGKVLYTTYCSPCHGANGDGAGKVGEKYTGVPNYTSAAVKNLPEGHIYHVITHGIRRMWPHKALLTPEERWKVVRYVQDLQQGKI